jgi:hypothetical protein
LGGASGRRHGDPRNGPGRPGDVGAGAAGLTDAGDSSLGCGSIWRWNRWTCASPLEHLKYSCSR